MTAVLPEQAAEMICPVARVRGKGDTLHCQGPDCAAWRRLPMSSMDPRYLGAVKREEATIREQHEKADVKVPSDTTIHKEAVARVAKDPDAYTFPDPEKDRGYCGMGGKP